MHNDIYFELRYLSCQDVSYDMPLTVWSSWRIWHQCKLNLHKQLRCSSSMAYLSLVECYVSLNSLRPRQNRRHFADDVFKCNFLNENVWSPIQVSLKFVPKRSINNIPALVQIMAWRRPGDKPLSEPMMVKLPTHVCVTRHQWFMLSLIHGIFCFLVQSLLLNRMWQ